jgi:hypothetical protein
MRDLYEFVFLRCGSSSMPVCRYGVAEPILEARRTEARVFARDEALIVNLYAVVVLQL